MSRDTRAYPAPSMHGEPGEMLVLAMLDSSRSRQRYRNRNINRLSINNVYMLSCCSWQQTCQHVALAAEIRMHLDLLNVCGQHDHRGVLPAVYGATDPI